MEFPYVPMTYVERTIFALAVLGVVSGSWALVYMMRLLFSFGWFLGGLV